MVELSDNALMVLTDIYKTYLEREDLDVPGAFDFGCDYANTCDVFDKPKPNTVSSCLNELHKKGFIKLNVIGAFRLTNEGVAFMDNRFKHKIQEVFNFFLSIKK